MEEKRQRDRHEQVWLKHTLWTYQSLAQSLCAPLFWRDTDGQPHNGTITFVCTPQSQVLGVTNKHVADGLASCTDYVSSGLQIGGARLDPARLIARHQDLDLATFQLSDVFLATSGHNAATVSTWPPKAPSEGDPVIYGGFPASYREDYDGTIDFGFAIFVGKVQSVSDRNIAMVLEIERSESFSSNRIPPNVDLGGWSGGPVFRLVDSDGIERLELCAIIYEYSPSFEIAFAHPLGSLDDDGNFKY
jgi:hypothetical protein